MSVKVLSDTCGIAKSTIYKGIKENRIPHIRVGNSIRVDIDFFLRRDTVQNDRDSSFSTKEGEDPTMDKTTIRKPLTGKGTIQKKKNSAGTVYYQLIKFPMCYDDDGSIVYKTSPCFKTKEEAEDARLEFAYERKHTPTEVLKKSAPPKPKKEVKKKSTLYDLFLEYIEEYVCVNFKNRGSKVRAIYMINLHCKPYFSKLTLETCTAVDLQRMFNNIVKHRNGKTLYQFCARFFRWLKMQRLISENPMDFVSLPKHYVKRKQNRSPLSHDDIQKLYRFLNNDSILARRYKHIVLILLCTGMRPGELLGLERCNIDFKHHTAKIRKTVGDSYESERIRDSTKTPAGRRTVYLTEECCDAIKEYFNRMPDSPWVCGSIRNPNIPIRLNSLSLALYKIGKRAGLSRPLFGYVFRHSFATTAIRKGIPATELRFLMGHANASMIMQIYANHEDGMVIDRYQHILDNLYDDTVVTHE